MFVSVCHVQLCICLDGRMMNIITPRLCGHYNCNDNHEFHSAYYSCLFLPLLPLPMTTIQCCVNNLRRIDLFLGGLLKSFGGSASGTGKAITGTSNFHVSVCWTRKVSVSYDSFYQLYCRSKSEQGHVFYITFINKLLFHIFFIYWQKDKSVRCPTAAALPPKLA